MSQYIEPLKKDICINCNEVKIVKLEITLEFLNFPHSVINIKTGCICETCCYANIREYRVYLV